MVNANTRLPRHPPLFRFASPFVPDGLLSVLVTKVRQRMEQRELTKIYESSGMNSDVWDVRVVVPVTHSELDFVEKAM